MQKIMAIEEIKSIQSPVLLEHIEKKALELMEEYDMSDLDSIGCFAVLDAEESTLFQMDTIGVFIGASLPWSMRIRKINSSIQILFNLLELCKFRAIMHETDFMPFHGMKWRVL